MSRRGRGHAGPELGMAVMAVGLLMIGLLFVIPLDIAWSKYGDSALTIQVLKYEGQTGEANQASGAWINVEPTVAGANVINVFGKPPPSTADMYGLMSFYMDVGVYKWTVKYGGKQLSGYVKTAQDQAYRIYVYALSGTASYKPSDCEYKEGTPAPVTIPQITGVKTVYIETGPMQGLMVVVIGMNGKVYASHLKTPFQFTIDGTDFIEVIWSEDVEGYVRPDVWRGSIAGDIKIVGKYLTDAEYAALHPEPEAEGDSGEAGESTGGSTTTSPIDYEEEESDTTDTKPTEEEERGIWLAEKINKFRTDIRYQAITLFGILTSLYGAFLMFNPLK